ncbi:MAG: hypothetical protein U9R48_07000 [Chloroflexota bacterium]|nr:hypothetical protein [Chloroflexota bacterium]
MEKSIITALMIVAAIICTVIMFKAIYPAIVRSSGAVVSAERRVSRRMQSEIEIIHAAGELDADGTWQDVNGDGYFNVFVWVKNVGDLRISAVASCDLFFGPEGNFVRIPFEEEAKGSCPYWTWEIENGTDWDPTRTLKITIHFDSTLSSGRYFLRVTTPAGVADDLYFGM